ncbi:hypothetical protein A5740_18015 [Mycobacterium sp. GA-1841]|uniref:hypothetical protein n=1 Tax=Mycobacterium sp. GA-1841 TaxID=1834154 RepID=UPI00096FF760|nr:hypothetical protein [Mycobacterium sp. GA-1841]OMC29320.1 hypothetical protein A5740_18015 [Mycobacterium sp. GA-1841]
MSESVDRQLPTYTARVAEIRTILATHLPLASLIQNNRTANPIRPLDCLSASWGPDSAAAATLTLAIHPIDDVTVAREELRQAADFTPGTYEVRRDEPDEFALVQTTLSSVRVLVDHCEVYLAHRDIAPETLVEPAIEIARTVGAGPYIDDYESPA